MPDQPTDESWQEIDQFLFAGQKIQAIKIYRESTGLGLKEAKDAIEAREAQLRLASPEKFTARGPKGCLSSVLLLMAVAVSLAVFVLY